MSKFNPIAIVPINSPMMVQLTLTLSPRILPALENLWMDTHTFNIECPYPNSLSDNLKYILGGVRRFKFVPFANMGGEEMVGYAYQEALEVWLKELDAHVEKLLADGIRDKYIVHIPVTLPEDYQVTPGDEFPFTITMGVTMQGLDTLGGYSAMLKYALSQPDGADKEDLILSITGETMLPEAFVVHDKEYSKFHSQLRLAQILNSAQTSYKAVFDKIPASDRQAALTQLKAGLRSAIRELAMLDISGN